MLILVTAYTLSKITIFKKKIPKNIELSITKTTTTGSKQIELVYSLVKHVSVYQLRAHAQLVAT